MPFESFAKARSRTPAGPHRAPRFLRLCHHLERRSRRRNERAAYRSMLELDDTLLRDMGLSRDEVAYAANAALDEDIQLRRDSTAA